VNYLSTSNPFGLAGPPAHFLLALERQDPNAVIFPSMEEAVYRFCQRVKRTPGILRLMNPQRHPDTTFMFNNRLIGVCAIVPFANWGPMMLEDLHRMDTYRLCKDPNDAGDALADALDRLEEEKRAELDVLATDELGQRGASAWFSTQMRGGHTEFVQGYDAPI
jgi:hypothetical protein